MTKRIAYALLCAALLPAVAHAQQVVYEPTSEPLALSLEEALEIAYIHNYTLRDARLELEGANYQVRENLGQFLPQIDASGSYTRNLESPNPFSGSSAGTLFGSLGFVDWLAYNETARTDNDASTETLSFSEFADRQQAGIDATGVTLSQESNPFLVPNQFTSGIAVSQRIIDFGSFVGARGAVRYLEPSLNFQLERQEQLLIDQVRAAFYQALLATEQAAVSEQSVVRTQETVLELAQQVSQGTAPKFQRLSAEVELANLETAYQQAGNAALAALDQLKMAIGIPVDQPIRLVGDLEAPPAGQYQTVSVEDAVLLALDHRPDLEQLRLSIELSKLQSRVSRLSYLPTLSAFANFNYIGNIPANRVILIPDANDPFTFTASESGFWSSSYWNAGINVGVSLNWRIFDGRQARNRAQRQQIEADRSLIRYEQQLQGVRQEVNLAVRNLRLARQQIDSQARNVERAELNYAFAVKRLEEGVASPLEERNASEQLDLSRINFLQAVHDLLRAESAFETALGMPLANRANLNLTENRRPNARPFVTTEGN